MPGTSLQHRRRARSARSRTGYRLPRWPARVLVLAFLILPALAAVTVPGVRAQTTAAPDVDLPAAPSAAGQAPADSLFDRSLILESIEIEGSKRTSLGTVLLYLPLTPGQTIDQTTLLDAVTELRESGLFRAVDFYTRPGSARGRLILVLDVEDHRLDWRFATGNTDLDGWYITPVMLALDNPFGHGARTDLEFRIGFRHVGLIGRYLVPRVGDGLNYWGARLFALNTDRPYFFEDVEFRHQVQTVGAEFSIGRRLTRFMTVETGLTLQAVDADSTSTVGGDVPERDVSEGDDVPFDLLPPSIQQGVGESAQQILHLDLRLDSRGRRSVAGTATSGLWGRIKPELINDEKAGLFARATGDLRAYQGLFGGVATVRGRVQWVDEAASFYDRLYLGGIYTVRGFPTHSLSAPGGDTWLWCGTLEYRAPLIGRGPDARLAGSIFTDIGNSGRDGDLFITDYSASLGWGLRLRLGFLGYIGFDVGYPLTRGPYPEAFHINAIIGWSF